MKNKLRVADRINNRIKGNKVNFILMLFILLTLLLSACGKDEQTQAEQGEADSERALTVVGFSQVGAESDWRSANTESMKSVFTEENGYELIFDDAQQKQTNQIMAIRNFIQQEVDYIVLAPVNETGWDTVLGEAKEAGIPVIIVDRMVDVEDDSLFECWVGSDFELEALKLCEWLKWRLDKLGVAPEDVHIADIQGTIGSSAQIGRTNGLYKAARANGWDIVMTIQGEFTRAKGREAMEQLLEKYDNINVVYCENDNEAFGAIEAIEAAGLKVGSDITNGEIMILSFDGVKLQALQDVMDDSISCIAECNPLHGPRVEAIISTLKEGGTPKKFEYVDEDLFSAYEEVQNVVVNYTAYPVTLVTKDMIDERSVGNDQAELVDQPDNVY